MNKKNKGTMKKCIFFHRWKTILDDEITKYQECKDCGERRYKQRPGFLKPINQHWLAHETNEIG